tara:strand:- start:3108 stop:3434 length:327 start_codon:yes stop_codon:yes gene_type:complete
MKKELLIHFILGGILFSSVYYFSNVMNDPIISAIIGAIPITIICGFIVANRNSSVVYFKNVLITLMITAMLIIGLWYTIKKTNIDKNVLILLALIIWIIIQYIRYNLP